MDAKPQRPLAPRAIRVTDENMAIASTTMGLAGKTLHQRSKSITTLNHKRVLAEATSNLKVAHKDDSDIGKASPGKIGVAQEPEAPIQPLQRQAIRPLAAKNGSSHNVPLKSQPMPPPADAASKKVVPKKSKILRDVLPATTQPAGVVPVDTKASSQPSLALQQGLTVQHQEVRTTETVPLRDELVVKKQVPAANVSVNGIPPALPIPQPTTAPIATTANVGVSAANIALADLSVDQYMDEDFDDRDQDYMTAQSVDFRSDATHTIIIAPSPTKSSDKELSEAKAWVEANRTAEDIEDEQWDTSMVAEYGDDIFEYMRDLEHRMTPNPHYMDSQTEIQWSMRGVLMDWVIQVHQRFNLLPETLFLTINYIDRFLSCKVVSLGKLQLVGATAIFLAAKYEEVNCPTIAEIIFMVDNGYSQDELLKAERFMLSMLQFELGWPGPMSFLRRISKADDYDLETRTLAKYFLEVTIMDERFVGSKPSFLAAGAHCMARLMLRKGEWTKAHIFYSNFTFRQLQPLLGAIFDCCIDGSHHHTAVFDKYTDKRYKRASTFVRGEMSRGFQLPFEYRSTYTGPPVAQLQ